MRKFYFLPVLALSLSLMLAAPANAEKGASARDAPQAAEKANDGGQQMTSKKEAADQAQPAEETAQQENAAPEQALYPGVQNIVYRSGGDNEPHAIIYYPSFGNEFVDSDIKYFVSVQGADFSKEIGDSLPEGEEKPATYDQWEMTGFYTLSRPNPDMVSVTFNIYSYSGGAHGNLFIRCLNYNLKTGRQLELDNLFRDSKKALEILSKYTEQKLRAELGSEVEEDMLMAGTAPEPSNFLNLSLNEDGLVVEFQPYQVGPWSIGPQSVIVPLSELAPAGPSPEVWPQKEARPEK